ncbi:amino acid permease [Arthrobacter sp. SF27]|nr:amino acid permease [Arthrobacter sp. SF27]
MTRTSPHPSTSDGGQVQSSTDEAGTPQPGLGQSMTSRQLTMMGLGSAIGAGLFLGSGAGIQAAGPAVLISYLLAGTLVIIVMWALGEMAAAHPSSGAFSTYAEKAMGRTAGATIGWLWWLQLVTVIAAEAVGAAALLASVWPILPSWLLALVFMVVFTAINLMGVKNYGEFEFWFAIIKVAAIVAFLALGAALIFGWLPHAPSPGLSNLFGGDGFAPAGLAGIAAGLLVVIFAFGGTEIVAVAAAETKDPQHSVSRAIKTVVWRILVFYFGSVLVIATVVPWDSEALASPFAAVLSVAAIPGADVAITIIAAFALLSALNANLYGASRMIFSLSQRGEAPALLQRIGLRRVPIAAVLSSVAFGFVATVMELLFPEKVLPVLLSFVGSTCLVVWGMVLTSQLILRRRADREGQDLPMRMRGFPAITYLGLGLLAAILAVGFLSPGTSAQLASTAVLIAGIAVLNKLFARRRSTVR